MKFKLGLMSLVLFAAVATAGDCRTLNGLGAATYSPSVSAAPALSYDLTAGCTSCATQASTTVFSVPAYTPPVFSAPVYAMPALSAPVYVPRIVAAPVYLPSTTVLQRQVSGYSAPVINRTVVNKTFVTPPPVIQKNVFVSNGQFAQARQFGPARIGGGGFGLAGQFRQGVQSAGILGGLERLTGLGNGSGDFARGAIIGGLGVRNNLFGLRGR